MKKKRYIHVLLLAVLLAAAMHYSNRGPVMASEAEISTGGSSEESSEKKDTENDRFRQ